MESKPLNQKYNSTFNRYQVDESVFNSRDACATMYLKEHFVKSSKYPCQALNYVVCDLDLYCFIKRNLDFEQRYG